MSFLERRVPQCAVYIHLVLLMLVFSVCEVHFYHDWDAKIFIWFALQICDRNDSVNGRSRSLLAVCTFSVTEIFASSICCVHQSVNEGSSFSLAICDFSGTKMWAISICCVNF